MGGLVAAVWHLLEVTSETTAVLAGWVSRTSFGKHSCTGDTASFSNLNLVEMDPECRVNPQVGRLDAPTPVGNTGCAVLFAVDFT